MVVAIFYIKDSLILYLSGSAIFGARSHALDDDSIDKDETSFLRRTATHLTSPSWTMVATSTTREIIKELVFL